MVNKEPLVSIIIPTYNRANLIAQTLDSVLAQTYQNWECIIVDDGSSDNTDYVVGNYVLRDSRFKYYHRPDEHLPGGNGARNYGFKMSKGEYVNWLDSDDLLEADFLKQHIDNIKIKKTDVSICDIRMFCEDRNNTKKWLSDNWKQCNYETFCKGYIKFEFGLGISCFIWNKRFLSNQKLFCESLKRSQEYEFFSRILLLSKPKILKISNTLVLYRQHPKNKIKQIAYNVDKITSGLIAKKMVIGYAKNSIEICKDLKNYFVSDALSYLKYEIPQLENLIIDILFEMKIKNEERLIGNYRKIAKHSGYVRLRNKDIAFLQKNVSEFLLFLWFSVFRKSSTKLSRKLSKIGHS